MKGNFPDDTFTEADVKRELDQAGLHYQDKGRYILSQCPTHDDKHPSVQIYKDDWFTHCHAVCGRYHITKAFPALRDGASSTRTGSVRHKAKQVTERKYTQYDLMEEWQAMPLIPRDHEFKGIPLEVLDDLGWRWDADMNSYFIPYFSSSKRSIPFAQWRHLSGDRRFTFLKDAKPTMYGTWNLLDVDKIFLVEGTSDMAVLEYCAVACVAAPSAASSSLVESLATYCKQEGIQVVYAGDKDEAGDKLREALDKVISYRVKQAPKKYKDWGEFFEAEGQLAVIDYCNEELAPAYAGYSNDMVTSVAELMGGGTEYKIVDKTESTLL
jgi:5S rRNA maturation endonuclease (ribonuclease M5)